MMTIRDEAPAVTPRFSERFSTCTNSSTISLRKFVPDGTGEWADLYIRRVVSPTAKV